MKALVYIMDEVVRSVNHFVIDQIRDECRGINAVNYMHGHWKEISARLIDMGKNPELSMQKFPLVVLLEDFAIDKGTKNPITTVQILILVYTEKNYNSEERQTINFDPILDPIYEELLRQIVRCGYFANPSADKIPHKKWDRKQFGKEDPYGSGGVIPMEYLDAIQLQNLQLILNSGVC